MELLTQYRFGDADIRIQGDHLFLSAHGNLTTESAQQVLELFRLMHEKHGRYFMTGDLQQGGGVPANARRVLAQGSMAHAPVAVAFYGASLAVRASNALMVAAIKMLGGTSQNVRFFSTAAEAEAWIAEQRLATP